LPPYLASYADGLPRLGRFAILHPEIDVRIAASVEFADFEFDNIDLGIRYGPGRYPGLICHRLLDEELFPVCSPVLRSGARRLELPEDLAGHTLLHDENRDDWGRWLRAAGVETVDSRTGPLFTDASLLIQAAVAGQGVGLARRVLVASELASGRLVRPFEAGLALDWSYYLVYPPNKQDKAHVQAFRWWLVSEVASSEVASGEVGRAEAVTT